MIIKTVDKNSISNNVSNSVGLCYFDPDTETLKEFTNKETITLVPFENSVRRFYFVKNDSLVDGKVPVYVQFEVSTQNLEMDIKINLGQERLASKYDYYNTEINNTVTAFFSEYSTNLIPIDIYFKSNTNKEIKSSFIITLNVE